MCHHENAPWKESGTNVGHYNERISSMLAAIFPVVSPFIDTKNHCVVYNWIQIKIIHHSIQLCSVWATTATATQSFSFSCPCIVFLLLLKLWIEIESFVSLAGMTFHRFVANRVRRRGLLWPLSSGLAILIQHWIPSSMPISIVNSATHSSAH